MVGIAYGLIKWVGRNVRSLVSDSRAEQAHMEALAASIPAAAADALVRQGIVSPVDLARMTPRERGFFAAAAGRRIDAATGRNKAQQATPTSSEA